MPLIDLLSDRLKRHPKRVVFPEGSDPRIIQAARKFVLGNLGVPILLGDRSRIKQNAEVLNINLKGIRIIEPSRSEELDAFAGLLSAIPRFKESSDEAIDTMVKNPRYFAPLMVMNGNASGMVAGATLNAISSLRPILQVMPRHSGIRTVSSLQMLDFEEPVAGLDGVLFLADCAVIPSPTAQQLADMAMTTGLLARHLTGRTPRIAFLSYTSKSENAIDPTVRKMVEATALARTMADNRKVALHIDGELQVDAAIQKPTADLKGLTGEVAGQANVLIFPDLQAANIGSKLAQILTGARTYGSLLTGLTFPCAEISRGASAHDIFGTAVMVGAQATDQRYLHPDQEPSWD